MQGIGNYYEIGFVTDTAKDSILPKLLVPAIIVGGVWLLYEILKPSEYVDWDNAPQYARDAAWRNRR